MPAASVQSVGQAGASSRALSSSLLPYSTLLR
jgi:hypothetical protein